MPQHTADLAATGHYGLLGMRERAELAGGRLRLNAEAFMLDYTDLQVYELLGLTLVTSNAEAEASSSSTTVVVIVPDSRS